MRYAFWPVALAVAAAWACSGASSRDDSTDSETGGASSSDGGSGSESYAGKKSGSGGAEQFAEGGTAGDGDSIDSGGEGSISSSGGDSGAAEGGSGGGSSASAGGLGDGGTGGNGPMPPEGDPCEYPESDFAYDCGGVCGPKSGSSNCDCNPETGTSEYSAVRLFSGEGEVCGTCGWAGLEREYDMRVSDHACAKFTSMEDSGVEYVIGGCKAAPVSGCQIVSSVYDEGSFTEPHVYVSLPAWPVWMRVEVAPLGGSPDYACPLSCP